MTRLKAWTPIIVALLALIGCVWSAYYQSGKSDTYDAAVKALVDKLNNNIIPHIQESLADIRERLAVIEAGCCKKTAERNRGTKLITPSDLLLRRPPEQAMRIDISQP